MNAHRPIIDHIERVAARRAAKAPSMRRRGPRATDYAIRCLLTGALPPAGTVCQQNAKPFPATTG